MINVPQKQRSKRKWPSIMYWIVLSVVIVITLMLIGVIFWLVKTQELDKLYTKLGIIASILTILISPLIFLFTISKKPDSRLTKDFDPHIHIHPIQSASPQLSTEPAQISKVWNVLYRRNPFFTGRENQLKQLHDRLTATKAAALTQSQAISGLGGIGKTQIAVEYAYRYRDEYQSVLWARAATLETLVTDFVEIAALLHLPERDVKDQRVIVAAVKEWLSDHSDWLLILDNADNMELVSDFLPTRGSGHILLTTRFQATGSIADAIEVERMNKEEGIALLLGRAKLLSSNTSLERTPEIDRINAEAIVNAVDGLPLALDQAGAYIEETGCSVPIYLERYQRYRTTLLKRRGESSFDHPESVATTWSLCFEQIEHINPAAADLLRLCSFLAPDAIPEEIITDGVSELGSLLQPLATNLPLLDEAISNLRKFSLVRRDPVAKILNMHRLVQAVLKDGMDEDTQHQWAERTVRVVNHVFPKAEYETWDRCQRYLSQAQVCESLIVQYNLLFPEAARLLREVGWYLRERAQYTQAESLLQRSLTINEQVSGLEHPHVANSLNSLALLYHSQGRYSEAEPLYKRSLAIREKILGPEHPETAYSLNNWAELYREQGRYSEAEPLYKRSLAIREKILGPEHSKTAIVLNNLGRLFYACGQYEKAEPLYQHALRIWKQVLRPEDPSIATILDNLARLYYARGWYEKAEPLMQRALAIREKELGSTHPYFARSLGGLAEIYRAQRRYAEAEPLMQRALAICEKEVGPKHSYSITILDNLAELYREQGRYSEAEPLYQRVLAIYEKFSLSLIVASKADEPLYQRTLAIYGKVPDPDDPDIFTVLESYAALLRETNRIEEAAMFEERAKAIRTKLLP